MSFFFLSFQLFLMRGNDFIKINCWISNYRILRTEIWGQGNFWIINDCDFSVMFTTESKIIQSSWNRYTGYKMVNIRKFSQYCCQNKNWPHVIWCANYWKGNGEAALLRSTLWVIAYEKRSSHFPERSVSVD